MVFTIDDTSSMGGSLSALQANFSNLLSQIQAVSNGDIPFRLDQRPGQPPGAGGLQRGHPDSRRLRPRERDDRKDPIGGVRYEVNVISPDAEPVAVELAVRSVDGKYTELTWPHTVHHKHYVVYRSENPEAGGMEAIGEVDVSEAFTETTAVRFVDASDATRHYFYAVESHTDGNKTLSGWVTLGAPPNR